MSYDFNTAGEQRSFEVMPDGTIAVVQLNVRRGGAGADGILKLTNKGDAEGLDTEITVVEGEYAKRKLWAFMIVSGTTDGHATAGDITVRKLRAIIESSRGIKPADVSEAAKAARVAEFSDFDGVRFMAKIGVEPARGDYKAKNILAEVITPDRKEWHPIEQDPAAAKSAASSATPTAPIKKPDWAK
jgi:hypothetical protein